MGTIKKALPVKIFIGMLSSERTVMADCEEKLVTVYGPVDLRSDIIPWNHSDYYQQEMGDELLRQFIAFERLQSPDTLPEIKRRMIEEENNWRGNGRGAEFRRINLDPGYITEAKVVLATTKDFAHRLYIGDNMYAEVELSYRRELRGFMPLEHTYPDFRLDQTIAWFNKARGLLHASEKFRSVNRLELR